MTDAAPDQNTNFNTGVSTSLSPRQAIFIHRIVENITPKDVITKDSMNNIVWVLSEDLSATSAGGELTDPRTLALGGRTYGTLVTTVEGGGVFSERLLQYIDFVVPIVTIAQKLNLLGSLVEQNAGGQPDFDVWLRIEYTVQNISNAMVQRLIQRLNLSPQP